MTPDPVSPRDSAVDSCTDAIRRSILTGEYKPGQRLPPERRLAELFGVNRVTVRSALTRLSSAKLLSVRQGSGYVVRDFQRNAGPEMIPSLLGITDDPRRIYAIARDVLHVRRHLSIALVEIVVRSSKLGPIDASEIRARVTDYERIVGEGADFRRITDADLAVIRAIIAASKSDVLQLTMNPLIGIFSSFPQIQRVVYRDPQRNIVSYQMVLEAIKDPRIEMISVLNPMLEATDNVTLQMLANELGISE